MGRSTIRGTLLFLVLALATGLAACGGGHPLPEPGAGPMPPDLRGSTIMVLPFQQPGTVPGDPDAELAFGLRSRGEDMTLILPPRLQEAVDRSPGLGARIRGLSVGTFGGVEVKRVGDPLYGDLLRLASLVNAEVALVPIRAWVNPGEGGPRVRLSAALIHVRTGRVLWYGLEEGGAFEPDDPRALASAAEALARKLLWYAVPRGAEEAGG